ncbi:hypothetical protein [Hyphococcus luteus]|uniref:Copper resistance protein D domain-containing protein n=1 Tax=Hyphococcus luteus TaxID=2058213 RepID=A0A2S7KB61_9PROT|nr:hypothetical protein [Marinicaulis flavus]PQA89707.1 hypothetical protein CW354_02300 [Marinicaulis flavus]
MTDLFFARALHVLGVVIWIGGVSMATLVVLPAVRRGEFGPDKLAAFHAVERRFVWIARTAVLLVGVTGYYMTEKLELWSRFLDAAYWWMHAMVIVWLLFFLLLFIGEPFILHRYFPGFARRNPERAFFLLHWFHILLLSLSFITILGAVAGAHGWIIF